MQDSLEGAQTNDFAIFVFFLIKHFPAHQVGRNNEGLGLTDAAIHLLPNMF